MPMRVPIEADERSEAGVPSEAGPLADMGRCDEALVRDATASGAGARRSAPPPAVRRLGIVCGALVAGLTAAYAAVLAAGLLALPAPDVPIGDPWFTAMELLILAIAPATVALMAALHATAPADRAPHGLLAVVFAAACAALTCTVHLSVLALSRHDAFAGAPWSTVVFPFRWPSVVYLLDVLAWDLFFPLSAFFAARTLPGAGRDRPIRRLLDASAALSLVGLAGLPLGDMAVRNVGILGYAVVFPIAAAAIAVRFAQSEDRTE
jgi:hypothetical protein